MNNISIYDKTRIQKLADTLKASVGKAKPVFLCFGDPHIDSQSIAPRVGTLISALPLSVYGTEALPLLKEDLYRCLQFICTLHPKAKPILIASAIGENQGCIKLEQGNNNLLPDTSMYLPPLSDLRILAIDPFAATSNGFDSVSITKATALSQAELIASLIFKAFV